MTGHPRHSPFLLCALAATLFTATAKADPPAAGEHLEKTATDLVTQVLTVVDAVKRDKRATHTTDDGAPNPDGVLPAALTVVRLLKGRFALDGHDDGEDGDGDDGGEGGDGEARAPQVFLKLKPRKAGGYLRCEVRF